MAAIPAPAHEHSIDAHGRGQAKLARPPRVEVVAITDDDGLLEQIGQALDGESVIRHAENPVEARGIVSPSQPCVLLLDARGVDDLARVVEDLQSAQAARVVVIFAPAEASDDIARILRGSATFAVLAIPIVAPQAAAVLEGAREESLARHALLTTSSPLPVDSEPAPTPDMALLPVAEPDTLTSVSRPRLRQVERAAMGGAGGNKTLKFTVGGVVLLLAAIAGYRYFQPKTVAEPPSAALPAAVEPREGVAEATEVTVLESVQTGSVDELLDSARAAMRARRYTDPEGQNALNFYRSVVAQEPDNGEAREGLERIAVVLHEREQSALGERRYDEASRTLVQLRSIRPGDPAIAQYEATLVEARISKAFDAADVERARALLLRASETGALAPEGIARWQTELDRRQADARAEQLAGLVSQRIRQGRLVEPANDSARHYLNQLRRLPGNARSRADVATTEMQQAYLGKLREALAKSQRADVERWKAEARAIGVSAAEISAVHRDVSARALVAESKQKGSRIAQLIQDRMADNRLLEPAGDSAVFHLEALRAMDPASAAVATSERALSVKLLEQGRKALSEQRLDVARAHAAAARQLDSANLDTVAELERDIAAAGNEAGQAGEQLAPKLVRTRYVAPEYPAEAMKQKLGGVVRVRLTVNASGRVGEAAVVQATPPGVFDAAAVAAARRWRFKPIGAEDSGVEAAAIVDIAFQPGDAKK